MNKSPTYAIRLVKVGGSLLNYQFLVGDLRNWLAVQPVARNIVVVGGGPFADAVRAAYRTHQMSAESAHWMCVRAMSVSALLFSELFPEASFAVSIEEAMFRQKGDSGLVVIDVETFLREWEPTFPGTRLEHNWAVTSDSIAARVAIASGAFELVMLKSTSLQAPVTLDNAVHTNVIDPFLIHFMNDLESVRCVNLRAKGWPEWELSRSTRTDDGESAAAGDG